MSDNNSSEKLAALLVCALLCGCNEQIDAAAMERAKEVCVPNGGVRFLYPGPVYSSQYRVTCNNGVDISGGTGNVER
jgi:hypothetical protein